MKKEDENRKICMIPNCGKSFIQDEGAPPFCSYHKHLIEDIVWISQNIQISPIPPSGLVAASSKEAKDIMRKGLSTF